jgi:DNA-binding SARP family transcriptional activator
MARWAVSVLGSASVAWTGAGFSSVPAAAWPVLGFLTSQRGAKATRGRIAAALWPDRDEDAGRHCLATTLWRLKRTLPAAHQLVDSETDLVRLIGSPWIDRVAFEARIESVLTHREIPVSGDRRKLRAALALYKGPFLDGIFSDWALLERERLACLQLDALFKLAQLEAAAGNWPQALRASRLLCQLEPLREDGHRLLMRAYAKTGNRALALRQFKICADVLTRDLAVDPMPETRALAAELSGRSGSSSPEISPVLSQNSLAQAREYLVAALGAIDTVLIKIPAETIL